MASRCRRRRRGIDVCLQCHLSFPRQEHLNDAVHFKGLRKALVLGAALVEQRLVEGGCSDGAAAGVGVAVELWMGYGLCGGR